MQWARDPCQNCAMTCKSQRLAAGGDENSGFARPYPPHTTLREGATLLGGIPLVPPRPAESRLIPPYLASSHRIPHNLGPKMPRTAHADCSRRVADDKPGFERGETFGLLGDLLQGLPRVGDGGAELRDRQSAPDHAIADDEGRRSPDPQHIGEHGVPID